MCMPKKNKKTPVPALTQLRDCSQKLQTIESRNIHEKKFRTDKILTSKNFEPMKYPPEKLL